MTVTLFFKLPPTAKHRCLRCYVHTCIVIMNSFVIFQVCWCWSYRFDKELVDLESSLITKDKYMIDCMKWLKSATGGGWALAIRKWTRFWSFMIDPNMLRTKLKVKSFHDCEFKISLVKVKQIEKWEHDIITLLSLNKSKFV